MKALFDTSVQVAALVKSHPMHSEATGWLESVQQRRLDGVVSAHGLAELYATLSAMPAQPRLSAQGAARVIQQNVIPCFSIRSLNANQYVKLIARLANAGLEGGVVYDAVHAEVARRAGVDCLVTFNGRHFQRVWDGDPGMVVSPLTTSPP